MAGLAGLLRVLAPVLPIVQPSQAPGFGSVPLLFVLGLLPVVSAGLFALLGNGAAAAGLLGAVAGFAPGQAVVDLQLVTDVSTAPRPDLVLPSSLSATSPAIGMWVLLTGHAVTILAGVLAAWWYRTRGDAAGWATADGRPPGLGAPDDRPAAAGQSGLAPVPAPGRVALLLSIGVLAGIGLLLSEPFESANAFLLSRSVLEQSGLAFAGGLLLVAAAPVVAGFAAAATEPSVRRGGLIGVAIALVMVALPQLVSGLAVPTLSPTWGPMLVLLIAVVLGLLAVQLGRGTTPNAVGREPMDELTLPAPDRLHAAAGALGLLAGLATLVAGLGVQIVLPADLPQLPSYSDRLLLPAGLVVGALGAALLLGALARLFGSVRGALLDRLAFAVRPAYLVVLVLVPLAAAQSLDGVLAATEIDGVRITTGPWLCLLAALAALIGMGCALVAGGIEREDVDLTDLTERRPDPVLLTSSAIAAVLAVGAFVFPTFTGPEFAAPSLSAELSIGWWGLALSLLVLLAASALAPFSRPARALALLLGAAAVVGVHLLELPLTSDRVRDFSPGLGIWLGGACLLAFLLAAAVVARRVGERHTVQTGRARGR